MLLHGLLHMRRRTRGHGWGATTPLVCLYNEASEMPLCEMRCVGVFFLFFVPQPCGSAALLTSVEVSCGDAVSRASPLISRRARLCPRGSPRSRRKNFTPVLQPLVSVCLFLMCRPAGYKISYRVDSRDPQRWTTVEVGSNGRQFTVTGLSAEQTYVFRLIARTAVGWGEQLEALVVTTERRGQSS